MPKIYRWQHPDWPHRGFDASTLKVLTEDVRKTSDIQGERRKPDAVRWSIAGRLGVDIGVLAPADRQAAGVVEMVLNATVQCAKPRAQERLFAWHAALFPTDDKRHSPIRNGSWRDDDAGPIQAASGMCENPNPAAA